VEEPNEFVGLLWAGKAGKPEVMRAQALLLVLSAAIIGGTLGCANRRGACSPGIDSCLSRCGAGTAPNTATDSYDATKGDTRSMCERSCEEQYCR
jgi:hypothetical protein